MREQRRTQFNGLWPSYGLIAGTGIGTILGVFFGHIALGAAFGSAIGLIVGAAAEALWNRER